MNFVGIGIPICSATLLSSKPGHRAQPQSSGARPRQGQEEDKAQPQSPAQRTRGGQEPSKPSIAHEHARARPALSLSVSFSVFLFAQPALTAPFWSVSAPVHSTQARARPAVSLYLLLSFFLPSFLACFLSFCLSFFLSLSLSLCERLSGAYFRARTSAPSIAHERARAHPALFPSLSLPFFFSLSLSLSLSL